MPSAYSKWNEMKEKADNMQKLKKIHKQHHTIYQQYNDTFLGKTQNFVSTILFGINPRSVSDLVGFKHLANDIVKNLLKQRHHLICAHLLQLSIKPINQLHCTQMRGNATVRTLNL